jgi:hypothetical protein
MRPATALLMALLCLAPLCLAACSKPRPPVGKWEGGYQSGSVMVAARVEIGADGLVRVSAPDLANADGTEAQQAAQRDQLAAALATGWDGVAPRPFDFDGDTFRKPGHFADEMKWDKTSNQMTLMLYLGANPALPVPLRPVASFHDNPWASG